MKYDLQAGAWLAFVLAAANLSCVSIPKHLAEERAKERERTLAQLSSATVPLYQEVFSFLWEAADREYIESNGQRYASATLNEPKVSLLVLQNDQGLRARWDELATRLLALPYSGKLSDDLLLENVRYAHFYALKAGAGDDAASREARELRLHRFPMVDVPPDLFATLPCHRGEAATHYREVILDLPYAVHTNAIRTNTQSLSAQAGFEALVGKLLDIGKLPATRFPKAHNVPPNCPEHNTEFLYAELARALRADRAALAPSPRPVPPELARLGQELAAEKDPLLKETFAWLIGLARDNTNFKSEWLGSPSNARLGSQLALLQLHARSYIAELAKERAQKVWTDLAMRAAERPWSGKAEEDLPLLTSLMLLRTGHPGSAAGDVLAKLDAQLERGNWKGPAPDVVLQLAAARSRSSPVGAFLELIDLEKLSTGQLRGGFLADGINGEVRRHVVGALSAFEADASPGSATSMAVRKLRFALGLEWPKASVEGGLEANTRECLKRQGVAVVAASPEVPVIRVDAPPAVVVKTGRKVTRKQTHSETYTLTDAERLAYKKALEHELAQLEQVSDYATYASGRAARLQAVDKQRRYGLERARDRNVDAAAGRVEQTALDARKWVEAERARIARDIAELDQPQTRTTVKSSTVDEVRATLRVNTALLLGGKVVAEGERKQTVDAAPDEAALALRQSDWSCAVIEQKVAPALRALTPDFTAGDTPRERAAAGFVRSGAPASLQEFLKTFP